MHRVGTSRDEVNPSVSELVWHHEAKRCGLAFALQPKLGRNANGTRLDALDVRGTAAVLENGERHDRDGANSHTLAQASRREFRGDRAISWCFQTYSTAWQTHEQCCC